MGRQHSGQIFTRKLQIQNIFCAFVLLYGQTKQHCLYKLLKLQNISTLIDTLTNMYRYGQYVMTLSNTASTHIITVLVDTQ